MPSNLESVLLLADESAALSSGSEDTDGFNGRGSGLRGSRSFSETSADDVDFGLSFTLTADLDLRYGAVPEDL